MENASKALLIIGGVLLSILVIGLLVFSIGKMKDFVNSGDTLSNIENIAKFNEQFSEYDRNDVQGYELISLANKVADYNNRFSNLESATNNQGYNPITMKINFNNNLGTLKYELPSDVNNYAKNIGVGNSGSIFSYNEITQSEISNDIEKAIINATNIEKVYGNVDTTTKIAKNISGLIIRQGDFEDSQKSTKAIMLEIIKKFYEMIKNANDIEIGNLKGDLKEVIENENSSDKKVEEVFKKMQKFLINEESILKYYQFYQFKRAEFECTNLQLDSTTGRVKYIEFKFTGKIN